MDTFPPFVIGIAGAAVIGFVTWTIGSVIKGRDDLHKLELNVVNNYVKRDAFNELLKEFRHMSDLMIEMAAKLGIRARRE